MALIASRGRVCGCLSVVVLGAALCLAVPSPSPAQTDARDGTVGEDAQKGGTGGHHLRWRELELRGTLFAHGEYSTAGGQAEDDYEAERARVSLRWRPVRWFHAEVEGDAADKSYLKDAFIRLRAGPWRVRAGQFKPPVSSIELESAWDLPVARRGLVRDVVVDSMGIGGRRPGVEITLATRSRWGTDTSVGVFQASHLRGDRIGDEGFDNLARDVNADTVKVAGRMAVSRKSFEGGLFGEWRPAEPVPGEGTSHYWAAGIDLKWLDKPKRGGRRVWMDGFVGSSWQDDNAFDGDPTMFVAGRIVGAWRRGGGQWGTAFAEPYAAFSLVDPDTKITNDLLWEAAGGFRFGLRDRVRLTIETRHRNVAVNAPASLGLFVWGDTPPFSRTTLVVQLGAAF